METIRIGHRGAAGHAPENTVESFLKAVELGVDAVECDVMRCASGELVVFHDRAVDRLADASGFVRDLTLGELRALPMKSGARIPTFAETLDAIAGKTAVFVELKERGIAADAAAAIGGALGTGAWKKEQFMVISFVHPELAAFRALMPEIKTGALIEGVPVGLAAFAADCGADAVVLAADSADAELLADARARGLEVFAYGADEPPLIAELQRNGVDGIISNFPERV